MDLDNIERENMMFIKTATDNEHQWSVGWLQSKEYDNIVVDIAAVELWPQRNMTIKMITLMMSMMLLTMSVIKTEAIFFRNARQQQRSDMWVVDLGSRHISVITRTMIYLSRMGTEMPMAVTYSGWGWSEWGQWSGSCPSVCPVRCRTRERYCSGLCSQGQVSIC